MSRWSMPAKPPLVSVVVSSAVELHGDAGSEWALLYAVDHNHLFAGVRPVFHQRLIEELSGSYGETHRWISGIVGGPLAPDEPRWFAADLDGVLSGEDVARLSTYLLPTVEQVVRSNQTDGTSAGDRFRFG